MWLACVALAGLGACGSEECIDRDRDGFGQGCEFGDDCDDGDPARSLDCSQPPPDCEADPDAPGCACTGAFRQECYAGAEGTAGVGLCRAGTRYCIRGFWSTCEDAVVPTFERCNGEDDDCDGVIDERVQSPCGSCDDGCVGGVWGSELDPFSGEPPLSLTERGELTLLRHPRTALAVWVANTDEGTVSRIDAREAREVARYDAGGAFPERVAVDFIGDAWVLSQDADGPSVLTRIAGDLDRCVGRDGTLQTSQGPDDVYSRGSDACVTLRVPLVGRAHAASLVIDGTRDPDGVGGGLPWVGYVDGLLEQLGADGQVLRSVRLENIVPYTAAFDPWGHLFVVDRAGVLARVEPALEPIGVSRLEPPLRCYELDSVASDYRGRLLMSGFACENIVRYDPEPESWRDVMTDGVLSTRGVVVQDDLAWVVHTAGLVSRVHVDPLEFDGTYSLAGDAYSPRDASALSADSDGHLWAVSRIGAPDGSGVATRFDPEEGQVTAHVPVGRGPRALGDFTGLSQAASFEPMGSERHVFTGCVLEAAAPDAEDLLIDTRWKRLHVAYDAGAGAAVEIRLRHAESRDALDDAEWSLRFRMPEDKPPFALELPAGGMVEVELTLVSQHHIGAPRVRRVGLEWACAGPD